MTTTHTPKAQGLYDPALDKDSCGVGFVVNSKGVRSHDIVKQGLLILANLEHRGATGADPNVGDGAGIQVQIPDAFLRETVKPLGFALPKGIYGVGMVFLPQDEAHRTECESIINDRIVAEGQKVVGWRTVPVDPGRLGATSRVSMPYVRQVFVQPSAKVKDPAAFERKLYVIRRLIEKAVKQTDLGDFSIPSFSCRTLVYKGMLTSNQLEAFYPDLSEPTFISSIALVHARYSTNTFPSWGLAHPFRMLAHNGEINTLRGNINWMRAREKGMQSPVLGKDLEKVVPIIEPSGSDSAIFDQVLEFLVMTGRSLPHAMMMMIPEAWDNNPLLDEDRRAFYMYHATLMEPWDGPAAMAFTDGQVIGATLDRNGLRPARIWVTRDDRVIMASETGVLPVAPEDVLYKTRLRPGRMFVVDVEKGRIVEDEDLKKELVAMHPYKKWVDEYKIEMDDLPDPPSVHQPDHETVLQRQQVFGYTKEDLKMILPPMAQSGE
ncbi:MAG TPA: glutamate synthase subunit alpha, partial [bacterium]